MMIKRTSGMGRARRLVLGGLVAVGLMATGSSATATMVQALSAPEMLSMAAQVFEGTVTETSVELDECQHVVTYTFFKVLETIKGTEVGETVVLVQLGTSSQVPQGIKAYRKVGPTFETGKTYVVFLDREMEPEAGHCTYNNPIGLDAGMFTETVSAGGDTTLSNAFGNRGLFKPAERRVVETPSGPLNRGDFLSVLKKLSQDTAEKTGDQP